MALEHLFLPATLAGNFNRMFAGLVRAFLRAMTGRRARVLTIRPNHRTGPGAFLVWLNFKLTF